MDEPFTGPTIPGPVHTYEVAGPDAEIVGGVVQTFGVTVTAIGGLGVTAKLLMVKIHPATSVNCIV